MSDFFNKISDKEVKRLFVLTIISLCFIVALYWTKYVIFLLLSCFSTCFLITGLILSLCKKWERDAGFLISIILAVISLFPSMFWKPNLFVRLEHSFYSENSLDFKQHKKEKPHTYKFIFCFDNSGGRLDGKYSDLLKEQCRSDLEQVLQHNDNTDDFMFITIGDPLNHNFQYEWQTLNDKNISDIKKKLLKLKSENIVSDFLSFYEKINNHCQDSITTLFIYSDFAHDLTEKVTTPNEEQETALNKQAKRIKEFQEKLLHKAITTIAFYAPIKKLQLDERNVLPSSQDKDSIFLKLVNIEDMDEELIPHKIKKIDNLPFFYYENVFHTNSELNLLFEKAGNHIIDVNKVFTIYDGNEPEPYEFSAKRALKNKNVSIKYNGDNSAELPIIRIIEDNTHYIMKCKFEMNYTIYAFLLWSCLMGVISGFCIIKKQNE